MAGQALVGEDTSVEQSDSHATAPPTEPVGAGDGFTQPGVGWLRLFLATAPDMGREHRLGGWPSRVPVSAAADMGMALHE